MIDVFESLSNAIHSSQLLSELIPPLLNLTSEYEKYFFLIFGNLEGEYIVLLVIIALLKFVLHSSFKNIKQSLPKPHGKKQ